MRREAPTISFMANSRTLLVVSQTLTRSKRRCIAQTIASQDLSKRISFMIDSRDSSHLPYLIRVSPSFTEIVTTS